ncbi:MAG TPA: ABC transporter substrate-binding protein, partial [Pyrinomonadaceae bacterium]
MRNSGFLLLVVFILFVMMAPTACRTRSGNAFVIALGDNIRTIDPIGSPSVDAASERVRTLIFNTLVKKNEKFDYVGELASDIKRSDDGLTYTFALRDGVKFHNGNVLSSADVKYTLDLVFASNFAKSASFFEGTGEQKQSYIKSVEAPDQRTVIVTLTKPWVGLLSNLVPIPIIPKDSYESQKTHPLGTGPFKFVRYDNTQQVCDVEAFPDYWDGPAKLQQVRVRVISDMNAMQ